MDDNDLVTLARMPPEEAATKLKAVGELDVAREITIKAQNQRDAFGPFDALPFIAKPWAYEAHVFGYIGGDAAAVMDIRPVAMVSPEKSLIGQRVIVSLDYFLVASYPGAGRHSVLVNFYADHRLPDAVEAVSYSTVVRVRDGDRLATINLPIFIGLNVAKSGLTIRCTTVNVKSEDDEAFLSFLNSDAFKVGLKLLEHAQPAIVPFSAMTVGVTRGIAAKSRNVAVQDFTIGLDFGGAPTGARLSLGSYVAVQVPTEARRSWSWSDWVFDGARGEIVSKDGSLLQYNAIVLGVSLLEE
ncbi:MAG TPA: hypothetical protein VKR56_04970 [Candidatus Cybelea sp.]|nr:hypothetical protein [Candidatus Cybelea sp.]